MKKIKILVISTSGLGQKEGISTIILDYFSRFDKRRFDITMLAQGPYSRPLAQEYEAAGIRVAYLPSRKENTTAYIQGLLGLFGREKFDITYVHGSSAIMSIELGIASISGCHVRIAHSHSTSCEHRRADKLLRPAFYRLYTEAFACGDAAGKWLFGRRPYRVIKNGRDVELYRYDVQCRQRMRRELGLEAGTLAIGHVGHFTTLKNQSFVLDIFAAVVQRNPDSRLYLMGDGPLRQQVEEKARALGLEDRVVFTGSVDNVPQMLQAMDVMVLPSLYEGLPLVAVEWQIAALPSLISDQVSDECAYSELVRFLPLGDPALWAEKLLEAAREDRAAAAEKMPELTARMGFDIGQNARELQDFFREKMKKG